MVLYQNYLESVKSSTRALIFWGSYWLGLEWALVTMGYTCSSSDSDGQPTNGTVECWKVPGDLLTQWFFNLGCTLESLGGSLSNSGTWVPPPRSFHCSRILPGHGDFVGFPRDLTQRQNWEPLVTNFFFFRWGTWDPDQRDYYYVTRPRFIEQN